MDENKPEILTIGYQGLTTQRFFDTLAREQVETIVDVRELPLSRKKGFSKSALADGAASKGLDYVHMRALGCPRPIRYAYREDRNWSLYTQRFLAYLDKQELAVGELLSLVGKSRCCLLCFEDDADFCHRSLVANQISIESDGLVHVRHIDCR